MTMLVYLDANIVMYAVEEPPEFGLAARARMRQLRERGGRFAVSHLVRMECRVGPLAGGDEALLEEFEDFFALPDVNTLGLPGHTFDRAAEIRAAHGFEAVDALHLAAALDGGCDAFFTNDARLAQFPELRIISLT